MGVTPLNCWSRRLTTLTFLAFLTVVQGQRNGPIRLRRNGFSSSTFGRVQVYFNSQWGNICDDASFGITEATVICHQLGYTGASRYSRANTDSYGTDTSPTLLSSVDCSTSSYLVILQCSYDSTPPSSCTDSDDVSVNCYSTRIWSNPYNGQIRLTRGTTVNQGLVEIYCSGQWGTVCDDLFGQTEADTICRQLGYYSAFRYDHLSIRGPFSQPIWLDEVSCSSARPCIDNCGNCPVTHDCSHSEDITITCHSPIRYTGTTSSTCDIGRRMSNGPIRLWRNSDSSSSYTFGRVQVYFNSQWGNICDDASFGITEATVICHQLGYTGASSYSRASIDSYGTDTSPTVLSSVDCSTSSYLVILQCSYDSTPSSSCTNNDDVSVNCYSTRIWNSPYNGQIRLTGGTSINQGLVEIYCSGQWGTVCDDLFGQTDADTVCRQLGYDRAYDYDHLSIQGTSSQPIWLDDVQCSTPRPCIGDCVGFCPTAHNCGHQEDITITCHSPNRYIGTNSSTCTIRTGTGIQNGPIRLLRNGDTSPSYTSGRVQLVYNRQWGNINDCSNNFGLTEATVICHQLRYTGASTYTRASQDSFGLDSIPTVITNVDCSTSNYLVILQCSFSSVIFSTCSNNANDVGVNCYTTRIWNNPYDSQVRLTGGDTPNQGLVEVYCNGQWGTVCDDGFGTNDANTICRQLGYYSASRFDHLSIRGISSQPIWLSDVPCTRIQSCLSNCIGRCPSSAVSGCGHSEDVTVECNSPSLSTSVTTSTCGPGGGQTSISNGPIRLWRNGVSSLSYTSGRVQLVYNNQWGNICDDADFRLSEATVVCHQLGYTGASSYSRASSDTFGTDTSPTVINNVDCISTYLVMLQCLYSTIISSSCTDDFDVSVACYTTKLEDNPYNLQVRLTRGETVNQGLVEVYCNGQWGTVCDDGFGQTEADTICRQLGYYSAIRYDHLSIVGSSFMPIVLDDVDCSFQRSCIGYCQECQSSHYCGHSEDVTIECYSPSRYTATNIGTCDGIFGSSSIVSSNIGAIIGGTIGGIILLVAFIVILSCIVKKQKLNTSRVQNTTGRVNLSTTRQTVVGLPPTTTTSVPTQPQQPPAAFNMVPRPQAAGVTFTYNYNQPAATFSHSQPTDPSITAAPPPAYGIADNYATYNEGQSDLPPPSYSEIRPSLSLPPFAPPHPAQSPAFAYPPSYPPQP